MKNLLELFHRRGHTPDSVALSAYLDRRLTPNESVSVDAHLETCAACRAHLAGLGEVRAKLRAVPQAEAPRSFRLRQADVEAPARQAAPAPWTRALPAFGGLAAAVFVVAIALDVTGGGSSGEQMAASRTTAEFNETSPAGGIAADSGGEAYDDRDPAAPLPMMPEVAPDDGTGPPQADGGAAATSAAPGGDMSLNAGTEVAPDVEAARDANSSANDDDGWPLSRYVAILAGITAVAAAGAWLGLTIERRRG